MIPPALVTQPAMPAVLTWVVWICLAVLAASVVLGLVRLLTASDPGSQAVIGDLVFFSTLGVLVLLGMLATSSIIADATLVAAVLGILATLALARIITRGRR